MSEPKRVMMVCRDQETAKDASDMFKHVAAALSAVEAYIDAACELDEDAADFHDKIGPLLMRLSMTLVALYPDYRQMSTDIKSIGDFSDVKTI